jgi:hypothetical protein
MSTIEAELINLIDKLRALGAYADAALADYLMFQAKGYLPELLELKGYATTALEAHTATLKERSGPDKATTT